MSKNIYKAGKKDGNRYKKQGFLDSLLSPAYHPPKDRKEKKSYDTGHRKASNPWF